MQISATIITLNEERNIASAIDSLSCADEVLVVDSGSTDQTREMAILHGARVIEEPWRGYAAQKNFAAASATHDWILSLDADEQLTPELAAEILALKKNGPSRRRLFVPAPGAIPRALDPPQRLVSGPENKALQSRPRRMGRRLRA